MLVLLDKPSKAIYGRIIQSRSGAHFVAPLFDLPRCNAIATADSKASGIQRMSDASRSFRSRNSSYDEKVHRSCGEGNKSFFSQRVRWLVGYLLAPKERVDAPAIKIVKCVHEPSEQKQSLRVAIKNILQKRHNASQCKFGALTRGFLAAGSIGLAGRVELAL